MLVYAILSGIFIGTYFSVDLAVMSLVLPNKEQEGRDMGILAVATGPPQIGSALIAGTLITFLGGCAALYIVGATADLIVGLGLESAHVVGQSIGGIVAQLLVDDHPGRVRNRRAHLHRGEPRARDRGRRDRRERRRAPADHAPGVHRRVPRERVAVRLHRPRAGHPPGS
ncbi:MAG: hypothetical protein H7146_05710, partial [Burkholderiaceae bacterium]|nr:hypothetical protein [Microbacteriaceae bacterium]